MLFLAQKRRSRLPFYPKNGGSLTTYDLNLFKWFIQILENMQLHKTKLDIQTVISLTTGQNSKHKIKEISKDLIEINRKRRRKICLGRLNFGKFFSERCSRTGMLKDHVFCHGGRSLSNKVFATARKYGCTVHESITFA